MSSGPLADGDPRVLPLIIHSLRARWEHPTVIHERCPEVSFDALIKTICDLECFGEVERSWSVKRGLRWRLPPK